MSTDQICRYHCCCLHSRRRSHVNECIYFLSNEMANIGYMQAVAASFCFSSPPKMNLNMDSSASKFRKKANQGSRNGFSEINPYGRQSDGDEKRQFVRYQPRSIPASDTNFGGAKCNISNLMILFIDLWPRPKVLLKCFYICFQFMQTPRCNVKGILGINSEL